MSMFSNLRFDLKGYGNNRPPIPGYDYSKGYFQELEGLAAQYRGRAEKRRGRAIRTMRKGIDEDARQIKGAAIARALGSGLASSSAVGTAAGQAARFKTSARGQLAGLIASPPQYEADPFYAAMLEQWLMNNKTMMGIEASRHGRGSDNTGAWAGLGGQLGGALIGGLFGLAAGGPVGAGMGAFAAGGGLPGGSFGGFNPFASFLR